MPEKKVLIQCSLDEHTHRQLKSKAALVAKTIPQYASTVIKLALSEQKKFKN